MPLKGQKAHTDRLRNMSGAAVGRVVSQVLLKGAAMIRVEAQHSITLGAVSGKGHVPSSPGEPPNNDTGHLKDNIEDVLKTPVLAEVSSNADYAGALETGTSKMAARPSMRPARDKMEPKIQDLFAKKMSGLVKKSKGNAS